MTPGRAVVSDVISCHSAPSGKASFDSPMLKSLDVTSLEFYNNEKYVIGKVLQGGMGSIFQLVPINAGSKTIALKTVQGATSIRSFDVECEAWLSVAHHKYIARAFAFGRWEGLPGVLVDWYPRSLSTVKVDRLTDEALEALFQQTIAALDFAHSEAGLIHQDVKPANVLLDVDGNVRLGDFGLARCVSRDARAQIHFSLGNLSQGTEQVICGTPFFMAPELWSGRKPSVISDMFSLGVTFYSVITGEHPYLEPGPGNRISRRLRREPLMNALKRRGQRLTKLIAAIEGCLALDPADRYQTYLDTGFLSKPSGTAQLSPGELNARAVGVAGRAMLYCEKGEPEKALKLLETELRDAPDDLILLGALAKLKANTGLRNQEEKILSESYKLSSSTNGVFRGELYPDLAARWAGCLIRDSRFEEARDVLRSLRTWSGSDPVGHGKGSQPVDLRAYGEVGWLQLYEGQFESAAEHLEGALVRRRFERSFVLWLVEASWLANTIGDRADFIAKKLLALRLNVFAKEGEMNAAWCLLLVRVFANPILAEQLWRSGSSFIFSETSRAEKEMGFKGGTLLLTESLEAQKYIIGQLDNSFSGGRHRELIRSVSDPRVA